MNMSCLFDAFFIFVAWGLSPSSPSHEVKERGLSDSLKCRHHGMAR